MIDVRQYYPADWAATWQIIEPVFRAGESYPFSPTISEKAARQIWVDAPAATFVATNESEAVIGTYYIKPNQPTLGAHVCNCGYIVAADARGHGVASLMCEHSQKEAKVMGFKAMQYNLVVATNEGAVHLWKKHGFEVVGTLPRAFQHQRHGLVDALVMYKLLES
ncbi:MAG: GNAT family N-acetyltransferase [Phycisphaera sp. RhM]|jgi:ribosomal protein S18 acetylase RimI-like enzyme|nr:GNAT family N-acetyltransferase [Phycisphaera sp. RhM]